MRNGTKACCKVTENPGELYSSAGWKAELVSEEGGWIAWEILKQNVRSTAWFFLIAYSKVGEETETEEIIVNKTELELEDLENAQLVLIAKKMRKHFSGDSTKGIAYISATGLGGQQAHCFLGSRSQRRGPTKTVLRPWNAGLLTFWDLQPLYSFLFSLLEWE